MLSIDTYFFDEQVGTTGYRSQDSRGVKLSIDTYLFDQQVQRNKCIRLDTYLFDQQIQMNTLDTIGYCS